MLLLLQDNHYRTLMNQIISSAVKTTIMQNFLFIIPITFRYFFDQAPEIFCQAMFFIRQCLALQVLFYGVDFMIVYYIYNFHANNITAIQDEFWICFINIWNLGFSVIAYFVFYRISDNRPKYFYFCIGKISKKLQANSPFENYIFDATYLFTLTIFIILGMKSLIQKYQIIMKKTPVVKQVGHYFKEIKKSNLFSIFLCSVAGVTISTFVIMPLYIIEYSDWDTLSTFPGYLWIYMFDLYFLNINNILVVPFIYGRNEHLSNFAKRVTREKISIILGSFS